MRAKNPNLTLSIKGRNWLFILLPDKTFDKRFNSDKDDDQASAITLGNTFEVYFRKSDLYPGVIAHELLHVLVQASLVGSASLSPIQVEELCCEILGEHFTEIVNWTNQILYKFLKNE